VEQEVPAVGGVRLVGKPESMPVAEAVHECGHVVGQQAGGPKPFPVHDETAEGPPRTEPVRIQPVMPTPRVEGLIEYAGQLRNPVPVPHGAVGREHEPLPRQHAQARADRALRQHGDGLRLGGTDLGGSRPRSQHGEQGGHGHQGSGASSGTLGAPQELPKVCDRDVIPEHGTADG
jgi:hypothetical protein